MPEINLERIEEKFANHKATLKDLGEIKILDWKNPESIEYSIRFLFDEENYTLHISGDLGNCTAINYKNMRFETFGDFTRDPYYFEQKIVCHDRPFYYYDDGLAERQLKERLLDPEDFIWPERSKEEIEDAIKEAMLDLDSTEGIGPAGYDALKEVCADAWEWYKDVGKERSGIIETYQMAFQLAMKQIKEQEAKG